MQTLPRNRRWGWWAHLWTQAGKARQTEHSGNRRGSLEMVFSLSHGRRPHELMRWYPAGWAGSRVGGARADGSSLHPEPPDLPEEQSPISYLVQLLPGAPVVLCWAHHLSPCPGPWAVARGALSSSEARKNPAMTWLRLLLVAPRISFFVKNVKRAQTIFCTSSYGSNSTESACNAEDPGSIPGSGRFPEERNGNPLQYSCLENSVDGGTWWATVFGVAKESGD